mmetsp:Transcript_23581/g.73828  ORF Transcript_23581/g.73828 Transcript_23581/m.73828 type:complete len:206 (-) Transcript_23581:13-630(-)
MFGMYDTLPGAESTGGSLTFSTRTVCVASADVSPPLLTVKRKASSDVLSGAPVRVRVGTEKKSRAPSYTSRGQRKATSSAHTRLELRSTDPVTFIGSPLPPNPRGSYCHRVPFAGSAVISNAVVRGKRRPGSTPRWLMPRSSMIVGSSSRTVESRPMASSPLRRVIKKRAVSVETAPPVSRSPNLNWSVATTVLPLKSPKSWVER